MQSRSINQTVSKSEHSITVLTIINNVSGICSCEQHKCTMTAQDKLNGVNNFDLQQYAMITIVVLTLQPILKFPLLWNVKYLEISIPIILQMVWVVPSILSIVHIGQGHQLTLTIAAIFDHGNKLISE